MTQRPEIWPLLENHRFYPTDLGREAEEFPEEVTRVNFWLMIILARFWQPISDLHLTGTELLDVLDLSGWSARDTKLLLNGRSQRALLQPALVADPVARPLRNEDWPSWCWFGQSPALTGWLDLADVTNLAQRLAAVRASPAAISRPTAQRQLDELARMLDTANQAQSGLFLATTE